MNKPDKNGQTTSKKTSRRPRKEAPSQEQWSASEGVRLGPAVRLWPRVIVLMILLAPVLIAPRLTPALRLIACIVPAALAGTYRVTRLREGWIDTRLFVGFIPVIHNRCKVATVVALGVKYGEGDGGMGALIIFGPAQYLFGYIFDFLIPAIGGPYELSVETAKGREFLVWQGFNQEYFEKNMELLKSQTSAEIKSR